MSVIVVTGVNGFVGKHLVNELVQRKNQVIGVGREIEADDAIAGQLDRYYVADLAKQWPVTEPIDAVIHLAGLAAVGPSFNNPQSYINTNSAIFTHTAEHYLKQSAKPRIVMISSGAVYDAGQPLPLTEDSAVDFASPYTVSKVLVENQAAYYRKRGLDCIIVRPFNHIGPGQGPGFLVPDVISQLKQGDTVTVGNIKTKRDYTDVRDVAQAYRLLATEQLSHTLYNTCSGTSVSGEEIITTLTRLTNKPEAQISVDENKVRPTDAPDIYGDNSRLKADTGWQPGYSLEQTLTDCLRS